MRNVLPITFRALVLEGKKKINIRNVIYKGPLKKNQVLVKIHYSGICGKQVEEYNFKMGKDRLSVVDENTKVHYVNNLRIIDSSIMPDIVSGNLNASTIMIAEKAADIIQNKQELNPIEVKFA